MRIQLASDLHLELLAKQFPGETLIKHAHMVDILILAGDIARASDAVELFGDWPVPVIYVAGNHELYHKCYEDTFISLKERTQGTSIRFLERDVVDFGGVRVLGCILWTDYLLFGARLQHHAMANAQRHLNDHRVIRTATGDRFRPDDALREHEKARAWLQEQLQQPYDGKTLVVTHHGAHPSSVHPRYAGDITNAAFVSDLTELVERADFWFHGHVHDSFDYAVGKCRVVANPRGYARNPYSAITPKALEFENASFQPACVIDIY
ncbi:metallophosphoesterase [Burkholderia thailandensis]|uniref:metallophosphoesterase n=1 Tax=Burkholderia thailandensis TaxID=57975 RepID=UPI0009B656BD|nr:metallophosphoesterase [Burkholderia thailandensis]MCS3395313.1 metallophosphoesterase [Burkholderia thailandensis]MCS6428932.1 metallophosphoesterase [Burkholderia thailandensis]MCS6456708.1 metallophosphoesterase [Burkholderia thailandensis]MCS6467999.1 metallophosphoesterase [Burkholderia thailandensis]MCS6486451.1 metallophosphoesterase [Burkholderia thailandensis]